MWAIQPNAVIRERPRRTPCSGADTRACMKNIGRSSVTALGTAEDVSRSAQILRPMRSTRTILCLAFLAILCAGGSGASSQTLFPVRVAMTTSTTDAPLWIADRFGYFKDEGLSVTFLTFNSGESMIAPLSTGQLEVGAGSAAASLYNAVARGADVRLVADLGSDPPGYGFDQMNHSRPTS